MPVIARRDLATVVIRQYALWVEDCHADMITVVPVADVLKASAQGQGQALGRSPVISYEKRCCHVGGVSNGRPVVFAVARRYAHREIGHGVMRRTKLASSNNIRILTRAHTQVSILVSAEGALEVIGGLGKRAHLHRVSTPDLGQRIVKLGGFLS